ncbi:MAG: SpoIID/LytB domain-containing protein [bacterium]|nr:SpoIID/LytB domain-containing protein [bacterium]
MRKWLALMLIAGYLSPVAGCRPAFLLNQRWVNVREEPTLLVFLEAEGEKRRMHFEEYLAGVVAGEVFGDWPRAALEAQAIIARTFTLEALQRRGGTRELHGTDVCTNEEHFQAYDATAINDAIREAVNATRGMVITHRGRPVRAWFHADAGGRTATPAEGLGFRGERTPYLRSARVPTDEDENDWTATFTRAEIRRAAEQVGASVQTVNRMRVAERGPSGRATVIQIDDTHVSAPAFRLALGATEVRSTLILGLRIDGDQVIISGRGFGHGVGMSQEAARILAEQGRTAKEIIQTFYRRVEIRQQWD